MARGIRAACRRIFDFCKRCWTKLKNRMKHRRKKRTTESAPDLDMFGEVIKKAGEMKIDDLPDEESDILPEYDEKELRMTV